MKDDLFFRVFSQGLMVVLMVALTGAGAAAAGKGTPKKHPALSAQEKLIDCAQCHQDSTPEVYTQWHASRHGVALVKCYQCHGTFENFRVTPTRQTCAVCHANMMDKCPKDRACWQCHVPHGFQSKP